MDRFQCVAEILLDSQWTSDSLQQSIARFTHPKSNTKKRLSAELIAIFETPPSRSLLVEFLEKQQHRLRLKPNWNKAEYIRQFDVEPTRMRTAVSAAFASAIPALPSVGEFAEWCGSPVGLVDWLSQHWKDHYRVRTTPKRSGGIRILEAPRARLKAIQRKIVNDLLRHVPCHSSAHGFVRGRSAISFVRPHVGKSVVLRMDLQDFFPSIEASRVFGLFRSIGYPHEITQLLTNLCTATCSQEKLQLLTSEKCRFQSNLDEQRRLHQLYYRKHLPQGAPTSPSLANLIAYRLDCRLTGLAKSAGLEYTRYADDLLFSGPENFGRAAKAFSIRVGSIALDEGFQVQFRKTRIMRAATQQSAAGIVLNKCTNLKRLEYDQLKAILYNCARFGPSTQNRDVHADFQSHLRGRVNWLQQLHRERGKKLFAMFQAIDWTT